MPERPTFPRFANARVLALALLGVILAAAILIGLLRGAGGPAVPAERAEGTEVLYLAPSRQPELWALNPDDEAQFAAQLTRTGGNVYDYAAAPDGAWIAYSARNEEGGYDLWQIERFGAGQYGSPERLLPCGTDWCTSPAYQPDGDLIAYSRRQASGLAGAGPDAPRMWIYDRKARRTDVLNVDPNIGGIAAEWSPDGRYLAYVDERSGAVQVNDLSGENHAAIPAGEGASFAWSPDGSSLMVTRVDVGHDHPYTALVRYDLVTGQEQAWQDDPEMDASVPAWSPDGERLAVARRAVHDGPGKQIWLLEPDGSSLQAVTENPQANHAAYHWSPDGERLVFQRLAFGSSDSVPEVVLWAGEDTSLRVLAEDAFLPAWIK